MLENIKSICIIDNNKYQILTMPEFIEKYNITQFIASYYITSDEKHQEEFLDYIRSNSTYDYNTIEELYDDDEIYIPCFDMDNLKSFIRNGYLEFEEDGSYYDYLFISVNNEIVSASECREDYTAYSVKELFEYLERKHSIKIFYNTYYN